MSILSKHHEDLDKRRSQSTQSRISLAIHKPSLKQERCPWLCIFTEHLTKGEERPYIVEVDLLDGHTLHPDDRILQKETQADLGERHTSF